MTKAADKHQSPWRRDARFWLSLLTILLGLGLVDRGFAIWRDDLRNVPYADGQFPAKDGGHNRFPILENHAILGTMEAAGLVLLGVSVALAYNVGRPGQKNLPPKNAEGV